VTQAIALMLLRYALTFGGGYLVTSGLASDAQVQVIVGAILAIVPVAWGIVVKHQERVALFAAAVTGDPVPAAIASPIVVPKGLVP
jgi:hypothetical protein